MRTAVILELKANVYPFTLLFLSLGGGRDEGRDGGRCDDELGNSSFK
jgi:hypothetical protein